MRARVFLGTISLLFLINCGGGGGSGGSSTHEGIVSTLEELGAAMRTGDVDRAVATFDVDYLDNSHSAAQMGQILALVMQHCTFSDLEYSLLSTSTGGNEVDATVATTATVDCEGDLPYATATWTSRFKAYGDSESGYLWTVRGNREYQVGGLCFSNIDGYATVLDATPDPGTPLVRHASVAFTATVAYLIFDPAVPAELAPLIRLSPWSGTGANIIIGAHVPLSGQGVESVSLTTDVEQSAGESVTDSLEFNASLWNSSNASCVSSGVAYPVGP